MPMCVCSLAWDSWWKWPGAGVISTAAGADPDKIATCADSPAGKSAVDASMHLGQELNVNETPMLFIDGRTVPMMAVSYDQLKTIVEYQFSLDK